MKQQIGKNLSFQCMLAGHSLTLYLGPGTIEAFTKKTRLSVEGFTEKVNEADLDVIFNATDALMVCAIQAGSKREGVAVPSEDEIKEWIDSDQRGNLNNILSLLQSITQIIQFTNNNKN